MGLSNPVLQSLPLQSVPYNGQTVAVSKAMIYIIQFRRWAVGVMFEAGSIATNDQHDKKEHGSPPIKTGVDGWIRTIT